MNSIGITKEFDSLGRLLIPKDIRKRYNFDKYVEIITTDEGVLLKNPEYKLVRTKNECIINDK